MKDRGISGKPLSRRNFLKTSAGIVAVTIIGLPPGSSGAAAQGWSPKPGVASQRIEGVTKVTGQKIFARDFNARDLGDFGWPAIQWHAMFLRALTTTHAFQGVDLSKLDPAIRPAKTILGSDFATGRLTPRVRLDRDHIIDEQIADAVAEAQQQAITTGDQLDLPDAVEFDLVVQPGNRPDFLGQAVALLLFDNAAAYRAAKRKMQFDDATYQRYGPEIGPDPKDPKVFEPQTLYVKQDDRYDPSQNFSYFLSNKNDYDAAAKVHAANIEQYLATTPDLIQHKFTSDMRAMDPMFMEPESGLIWYDKPNNTMNVLLGTQSPDGDIGDICEMYGKCDPGNPLTHANLISCFPGGGFGGRDKSPFSLLLGLCADFADGNPVKLEYDRFEQFRVGLKRHACDLTGLIAVTPDQELKVVQMDMSFDGGGRKNLSPYVASLAALCAGGSYRFPMANIFAKATHTQNISGGSQRGFGGPQAFFATETAIDEICAQQRWDPLKFRHRNVVTADDTTVVGGSFNQELRLTEMLERAGTHPLWRDRVDIKASHAQRGQTYGTGLAMSLQAYGTSGDGVVAAVSLAPNGTWNVQSDAVDMGNGSATTLGVALGFILGSNASTVEMGGNTLFGQTGLTKDSKIGCDPDHPTWDDPHFTKKDVGSSSACLTAFHQVHAVKHTARAVFANTVLPAARLAWGIDSLTERDVHWVDGALVHGNLEPLPLQALADIVYGTGLSRGAVGHGYYQGKWVSADYETTIGTRRLPLDGLAFYPADPALPANPVLRANTDAMPAPGRHRPGRAAETAARHAPASRDPQAMQGPVPHRSAHRPRHAGHARPRSGCLRPRW